MPLRRADPGARKIRLFVKWIPAKIPTHRALWLVPGGPGYAGSLSERFAERIHDADAGLDIYIPDHRGTGRSTRLGCVTEESDASPDGSEISAKEWPACLFSLKTEWGDGLAAFNTTEAANDLGSLIARTSAPADSVFVFGVSYGTYLVQRYLQLYPQQPKGVVLDSIAPPVAAFSQNDQWFNDVARKLLDACDQDSFCKQKLGGHAWDRSHDALLGLEKDGCPLLGPKARPGLRAKLASVLMNPERRALVAAIGYRVARCTADDVRAVQHFLAWRPPPPPSFRSPIVQQHYSEVLSSNIALSELWENPAPPVSEVRARRDTAAVASGFLPDYAELYPSWPRYARDAFVGKSAQSDVAMLMLAGALDPATPVEMSRTVGAHFHAPHQTFVEFASASHGVFDTTTVRTAGAMSCGTQVILRFLREPAEAPDTSCMADMKPLDFRGSGELAQDALGTADLYEN